jgi:hypothetical protein
MVAPGPLGPAYSLNAEFYPHNPLQTKDRIEAFREHADLLNAVNEILVTFFNKSDRNNTIN